MADHLSMFLIGWLIFLLIVAWVLVSALIDLTANQVHRWFSEHWSAQSSSLNRITHRHRISR